MASNQQRRLQAVFFDFDSTISTPIFVSKANKWAVADNVPLFKAMSHEEQIANLGGEARVAALAAFFSQLRDAGVSLYIISIGFTTAFVPHLRNAGLLEYFDEHACVFGQDRSELREVQFVKGKLIAQIMKAHGWAEDEALFIDDSITHIERARQVCRTIHVVERNGMTADHMDQIRGAAIGGA